ncbi:hypothetical protein EDC63_101478 [Sulfurirhabdus autotrophica]|uniref:Uncharacterized protein n=2 Tax=Sulfurirhabdus autotrophica TaxID=1706046 RepID=A0A4R3YDE0_9PROT|nr:hypothetical protein EDC63_101478 [Sulfurirhabdus autotrophica]
MEKVKNTKKIVKLFGLGMLSTGLYGVLFINENQVLDITSHGHWAFVIPITIAFVISFAHGAFTSEFWDVLGIKAKK